MVKLKMPLKAQPLKPQQAVGLMRQAIELTSDSGHRRC